MELNERPEGMLEGDYKSWLEYRRFKIVLKELYGLMRQYDFNREALKMSVLEHEYEWTVGERDQQGIFMRLFINYLLGSKILLIEISGKESLFTDIVPLHQVVDIVRRELAGVFQEEQQRRGDDVII